MLGISQVGYRDIFLMVSVLPDVGGLGLYPHASLSSDKAYIFTETQTSVSKKLKTVRSV